MRISDWSSDVCSSDLPRRGMRLVQPDAMLAERFVFLCGRFGGGDQLERQQNAECPAFAGFAFEADFATHQLGELARDRQTAAAAADLAAANLPERLEQPLALLGGDSEARKRTRLNSSPSCASRMPYSA